MTRAHSAVLTVLVAGLGLTPTVAVSQRAPPDSNDIKTDLITTEKALQRLQETKDLIERQAHVLLPGMNVLVPRESAASLFVVLLREGRMDVGEVEAYAETIRRTTRTYVENIIRVQMDSLSRTRERMQNELARQRNPPAGEEIAIFPAPLNDWRDVRGDFRGNYNFLCSRKDGSDQPSAVTGTFHIRLIGDEIGTVRASFNDGQGEWPADGSISSHGGARGTGRNAYGVMSWSILFGRLGNQLAIQDNSYTIVFTPDHQDYACRNGILVAPRTS